MSVLQWSPGDPWEVAVGSDDDLSPELHVRFSPRKRSAAVVSRNVQCIRNMLIFCTHAIVILYDGDYRGCQMLYASIF